MTRPVKRTHRTDHAETATQCRRQPYTWRLVSIHRLTSWAAKAAVRIERAHSLPCYEPAGAFEARYAPHGEDCTAVYARWLGPEAEARLVAAAARASVRAGGDPS